MDLTEFRIWFTVVMFVIFVGIVVWAFSGRRKQEFREAARLALDDALPEQSNDRAAEWRDE